MPDEPIRETSLDADLDHYLSGVPDEARQACIDGHHKTLLRLLDNGSIVDNTTYKDWSRKWEFDETEWSRDGRVIQSLARLAASHQHLYCYIALLRYPYPTCRNGLFDIGVVYIYAMHMMCPEVMQDLLRRSPRLLHGHIFHFDTYFHRAARLSAHKALIALPIILNAGGDPLFGYPPILTSAIYDGSPEAVDLLYKHAPAYDFRGQLPTASTNQRYAREMVQYLLKHGVSIDELPLKQAPTAGLWRTVEEKELAMRAAQKTALWLAVENNDSGMVDFLLENGADCYIRQPTGETAVDLAREMRLYALYQRMTGRALDALERAPQTAP